ncbi:MAG: tetratricopeptide repeat protein [Burkholderiales bacterium]|nr:tetratricopeptide repeat protein [Burkholderiales bacterium]
MAAGFLGRVFRRTVGDPSIASKDTQTAPDSGSAADLERALELHRSGQLVTARECYLALVAARQHTAIAYCMLGVLAQHEGKSDAAVALIARALELDPDYVGARSNLGLVYLSMGRLEVAEAELRKAIEIDPGADSAHVNLALVLRERGNAAAAEAELSRALSLNPQNIEAHNNLGSLCKDGGRLDEAESHYRAALSLRPHHASIWQNLGAVSVARGDWGGAVISFQAATQADPSAADAWSGLGFALVRAGRVGDAEAACRQALSLRPDSPDTLVNLALVLKSQHDFVAAEEVCRRAIEIDPTHSGVWAQLGTVRQADGNVVDAEACYRRAIELDPEMHGARYNLGTMQLLQGRYDEGFALAESRFQAFPESCASGHRARLVRDERRRWSGGPLTGQRLLVWSEQGLGDSLMMLRFVPMLSRLGAARIVLWCEEPLHRIAQHIPGVDAVANAEGVDSLPAFDLHCPIMSLPFCVRISADSIPSEPYIHVPTDAQLKWATHVPRSEGVSVGVVWAGNPALRDDVQRSVTPFDLAPLCATPGVRWISLQKGVAAARIAQWQGPILDMMDDCRDFQDSAALIANLDLVISVDTAVVHLAGAMGKPVWLLNRAGSEWRWGLTGQHSPWYPSLRIFRQRQTLDWAPVISEIAVELARFPVKH